MKTNTEYADKRSKPRISIDAQPRVRDAHSGETIGELVNLSEGGLMIAGLAAIEANRIIEMLIPLKTADGDIEVRIGAESLWCEDANKSGVHWTGFQIIDISEKDQQLLNCFVEG